MRLIEKVLGIMALLTLVIAGNLWWWGIEYPDLINAGCHV